MRWWQSAVGLGLGLGQGALLLLLLTGKRPSHPSEPPERLVAYAVPASDTFAVSLVSLESLRPPSMYKVLDGANDQLGLDETHPLPNVFDAAGNAALVKGGSANQGTMVVTLRDDVGFSQKTPWNSPQNQVARIKAPGKGSKEAELARPTKAHRDERNLEKVASPDLHATAPLDRTLALREADPFFSAQVQKPSQAQPGYAQSRTDDFATKRKERWADMPQRSLQQGDSVDASRRSNQWNAHSFEITTISEGKRNAHGGTQKSERRGFERGSANGTAASSLPLDAGDMSTTLRATRSNPFFRHMYDRIDSLVTYPPDLALGLEQGDLVVAFRLYQDGSIDGISVQKPSPFVRFDKIVERAFQEVRLVQKVPEELMRGRTWVLVEAPYTFRNPLIR